MTWNSNEEREEHLATYYRRLQEGKEERLQMTPFCLSCSGKRNFKTPSPQLPTPWGVCFPDDPEEVLCFECLRNITRPQLEAAIGKWERHIDRLKRHLEVWEREAPCATKTP